MKYLLVAICAIALGVAIGWTIRGGSELGNNEIDAPEKESGIKAQRRVPNQMAPRVLSYEVYNSEKIASMGEAELKELLNALVAEAGVFGLSLANQRVLASALFNVYGTDPVGACAWIDQIPNRKDRVKIRSRLCEKIVEGDLEKGIEFVKSHMSPENGYLLPMDFLSKAAMVSADKFLEVERLAVTGTTEWQRDWGTYRTMEVEFPDDFEFEKVVSGLVDLEEGIGKERMLRAKASNIVSSWARQDPKASYEWLSGRKNDPGLKDFNQYLEGFASIRNPSEVGEFLGDHFKGKELTPDGYKAVSNGVMWKPDPSLLEAFYDRVGGKPTDHAVELIGRVQTRGATSPETTITTIFDSLSAEERETVLGSERMQKIFEVDGRLQKFVESSLISLGHDSGDVDKLPPPNEGNPGR